MDRQAPDWRSTMPLDFSDQAVSEHSTLYAAGYGQTIDNQSKDDGQDPMLYYTPVTRKGALNLQENHH